MVIVNTELMKKIQEMPIDVLCNFGNLIWISTNISLDDLYVEVYKKCLSNRPTGARLIGVEMGGQVLSTFNHPQQAIYLLGAEDHGLPDRIIEQCNSIVSLEAINTLSYNVAIAGSLIMYDRCFPNKNQRINNGKK